MEYKPKIPSEGINSTRDNELWFFAKVFAIVTCSFLAIYVVLNLVAVSFAAYIPLSWEKKLGKWTYESRFKDEASAEPRSARLQNLASELWEPFNSESDIPVQVFLMETSEVNAYMAPGGLMIVNSGLIDKSNSENSLAATVCHELGHFKHRHVMKRFSSGIVSSLFLTLLKTLGVDLSWLATTAELSSLSFSRQQETEADLFAIDCMMNKYGHLKDINDFFGALKEEAQVDIKVAKAFSYVSTHPSHEDRIQKVNSEIKRRGLPVDGDVLPIDPYKDESSSGESVTEEDIAH